MPKQPKTLDDLFHDTLKDIVFRREENRDHLAEDGKGRATPAAENSF